MPRFTITDLLIATLGLAVILMMWRQIPVYKDWHWNRAFEDGFADAAREITAMSATPNESTLRHRLDRDRSYYRRVLYPICFSLFFVLVVFVRLLSAFSPRSAKSGNETSGRTDGADS